MAAPGILGITLLLSALSMVGPLGIDAYLPSFHAIGAEFAADPLVVQQTLSVYTLCLALTMLVYGTLSDSYGRRPIILVGLVLYIVGSVAAACAPSIGWLIAARALQGLAAGAGTVVARAVVQDRFAGAAAHRVMSHMMLVFGLAPALAPVIGGWLQTGFGWRSVFLFLALFTVLLLVACWLRLDESLPPEKRHALSPRRIVANYWRMLRSPRFMLMALAIGTAFTGVSLYVGSAANFVMNILHLPETAFAWMFVPIVSGLMSGALVAPRVLARTSPATAIRVGFAIMICGGLVNVLYNALFTASIPWAVLPLTINTFGIAIASPGMSIALLSQFPDMRGTAASVQSFLQMFTFTVIAGLIAPFLSAHPLTLAVGHLGGAVVCTVLWTWASRRATPAA